MIFKVVANATPLYVAEMWKSRDTTSENVTAALDTSSTFNGHYKNRLVLSQNWNTFNPTQVGEHNMKEKIKYSTAFFTTSRFSQEANSENVLIFHFLKKL